MNVEKSECCGGIFDFFFSFLNQDIRVCRLNKVLYMRMKNDKCSTTSGCVLLQQMSSEANVIINVPSNAIV